MPELTQEDVQAFSAVKVREEMKTRHEWLDGKRKETDGKLTQLEGEDGTKAAAYFRELNTLGERADELAAIEKGVDKLEGIGSWLNDPEGRVPQPKNDDPLDEWKAATDLILESDGFKRFKENGERNFTVHMSWDALFGIGPMGKNFKVLGEDDTLAGVDNQFAPQPIRLPGVQVPVLFQTNNIAPTFLQGTTNQNAVPYMVETVVSEGAAETAEGATKPEATIEFTEASAPVRDIPVTLQATNQLLEDVGFMRAWIEGRLRLFVANREDNQLINGNGTPPNLEGILTVAGVNTDSFSLAGHATDGTVGIDSVYSGGIVPILEAFLDPSSVGMAAATWSLFQLAKDANNNYLLGGPGMTAAPRIWGVPVVSNQRFPAASAGNEAIAVWAREAAMVVRRNQISLAVSDSHASTFSSNVLTFRAEQRVAFPIFRPAGISVITTAA